MNKIAPAPAVESPLLALPGLAHAFFTRLGGVSTGLYATNNTAFGAADDSAHVTVNRARCLERLGLGSLVTLRQVHSPEVIEVDRPWNASDMPAADAMVTRTRGIALGILTADCAPVLLADVGAGVIGAAHAGWRGAFDGIIGNTVAAMEDLGAHAQDIVAVVGPCIAQTSYEVGPEFLERFRERDESFGRFFVPSDSADRAHFDLGGFVAACAAGAGVAHVAIDGSDTCALEDRFFSFRRATLRQEPDYGRQLSAIGLLP